MRLNSKLLAALLQALVAMCLVAPTDAQTILNQISGGGGSGTVTSVATGPCLTGGPITVSGTISGTDVINAQTGTSYTVLSTDACKLITLNNASAVAVTLPGPLTSGFGAGFSFAAQDTGVGNVTVTPQGGALINGAASLSFLTNQGCKISSDGTNYQVSFCTAYASTFQPTLTGSAQGDILYNNGTGYVNLGPGTSGQFLTTNGASANPSWTTSSSTGCPTAGCTFTGQIISAAGTVAAPGIGVGSATVGWVNSGGNNCAAASSAVRFCIAGGNNVLVGVTTSAKVINSISPRLQVVDSATGPAGAGVISYHASTTTPAILQLYQSNSSTIGTVTAVASGTSIGRLESGGADGTNFVASSQINTFVDNTVSTGVVPGRIVVATANATGTMTDALQIDSKQHQVAKGSAPTVSAGVGATVAGNDNVGRITLGTAPGTSITLTFAGSWTNAPACSATDETSSLVVPCVATTTGLTMTNAGFLLSDTVSYQVRGY